jgi:hypothetical protein
MSKIKKDFSFKSTPEGPINTIDNDQATCDHRNTSAYRLQTFQDGWIHDLVRCADCLLVFDAWYAPDSPIPNSSRENLIGYAEGIPEEMLPDKWEDRHVSTY